MAESLELATPWRLESSKARDGLMGVLTKLGGSSIHPSSRFSSQEVTDAMSSMAAYFRAWPGHLRFLERPSRVQPIGQLHEVAEGRESSPALTQGFEVFNMLSCLNLMHSGFRSHLAIAEGNGFDI